MVTIVLKSFLLGKPISFLEDRIGIGEIGMRETLSE